MWEDGGGNPASYPMFFFLSIMHNKILILDFGSQVTQHIARRVRDAGVYSEVHPCDVSDDFVRGFGAKGCWRRWKARDLRGRLRSCVSC